MGWNLHGANVQVPRTADIPPQYWIGRSLSSIVQRTLDMVEPWQEGEDPIETKQLQDEHLLPIVVPRTGRKPWWGIHKGHHAQRPQASPFIKVDFTRVESTDLFTVELTQTPRRPRLVRAYPGDYIPPLPWMTSAKQAQGGIEACTKFWKSHAYVYRPSVIRQRVTQPPDWFRR